MVERNEDVSGVSGTGNVAEFSMSSDGRIVIFWPDGHSYFPSLADAVKVHGHGGKTRFILLDEVKDNVPHCYECHEDNGSVACPAHDFGCPSCLAEAGSNV